MTPPRAGRVAATPDRTRLSPWLWSLHELPDAIRGFASAPAAPPPAPLTEGRDVATLTRWFERLALAFGLAVRSITVRPRDLGAVLLSAPLVVSVDGGYLVVTHADRRHVRLQTPEGSHVRVSTAWLIRLLEDLAFAPAREELEPWLDLAEVPDGRRREARRRMARTLMGDTVLEGFWIWEESTPPDIRGRLRRAGVLRDIGLFLLFHTLQYALFVGAWRSFGPGALRGDIAPAWVVGWVLVLLVAVLGQGVRSWFQGRAAILGGTTLKRYLLDRILTGDLESSRRRGVGWSMARVFESEAIEQIALGGGLLVLTGIVELGLAMWILAQASGWLASLLLLWTALGALFAWQHDRAVRSWLSERLALTDERVEALVGHRTMLAQDPYGLERIRDDAQLARYHATLLVRDRTAVRLRALVPGGWTSVALGGLVALALQTELSATTLAIAIGGTLLAVSALDSLVRGLASASVLHWTARQLTESFRAIGTDPGAGSERGVGSRPAPEARRDRSLLRAPRPAAPDGAAPMETAANHSGPRGPEARESGPRGPEASESAPRGPEARESGPRGPESESAPGDSAPNAEVPAAALRGVVYQYPDRAEPALDGVDLDLPAGTRVQLRGPSGSGKSTLLSILSGVRRPTRGRVRLFGLDAAMWSEEERASLVGSVPQFHENHIFAERLAFNLLMGRNWPPTDEDLVAAAEMCEALGLGPLLGKLPSGLNQPVGDGGWALSHGERSRIFLARALLAQPALLLADESFGALDPETRARCIRVCIERSEGLVVATHRHDRSGS